ncbi:hypothetical protein BURMUCF2_A1822, partial [Burkholderia multivorans CF2]
MKHRCVCAAAYARRYGSGCACVRPCRNVACVSCRRYVTCVKHFAMSHAHARRITRLVAHGVEPAFRRAARAGRA